MDYKQFATDNANAEFEGYPGIAHDFETMRLERDRLAAENAKLRTALERCARELDAAYFDTSTLPEDHSGRLAVEEARAALKAQS